MTFSINGSPAACSTGSATQPLNGTAACKWTPSTPGSYSVTYTYTGDPNYAPAGPSTAYVETVDGSIVTTAATPVLTSPAAPPGTAGQPISVSDTVSAASGAAPTGTVAFSQSIGGVTSAIGACTAQPLTPGATTSTAPCTFTPFTGTTGGTVLVTATYEGSGTDAPSAASGALSVLVDGSNPLTSFTLASSANPVTLGKTVNLSSTVAGAAGVPTGTVTFSDNASPITCAGASAPGANIGPAGGSSCTWVPPSTGTHTITATYSGSLTYAPTAAPSPLAQQVNGTAVATVVVTSSANPNAYDTQVTFTARITGTTATPAGTVAFSATVGSATTTLCAAAPVSGSGNTATATCNYDPTLTGGLGQTATITARTSGDATYAAASATTTQTEDGGNTFSTFTLSTSANPDPSGRAVALEATLAGSAGVPTGTVVFSDGGVPITCNGASAPGSSIGPAGGSSCDYTPVGAGPHTITASYTGGLTYAAQSAPSPLTQLVNGTAVATVAVTSSANPNAYNTQVTFTATITGTTPTPAGTVAFSAKVGSVTTTLCAAAPVSGSGNTATATCNYDPTLSGGVGQVATITATTSGDATYAAAAASATQTEDGTTALSTFTVTASPNPVGAGKSLTLSAVLTGSLATPTGTVTFYDNGQAVTCNGASSPGSKVGPAGGASCVYTPSGAGTHTITAVYSGDANYLAVTPTTTGYQNSYTETVG